MGIRMKNQVGVIKGKENTKAAEGSFPLLTPLFHLWHVYDADDTYWEASYFMS